MTFRSIAELQTVSRRDITALNKVAKPCVQELRTQLRKYTERVLLSQLSSSEIVTFVAIVARTLAWQKVLEVIPLQVFKGGIFDHEDNLRHLEDEDGWPVFSGTGLDKGTLRKALDALDGKGLIERFKIPSAGRETIAYMPFSAACLSVRLGTQNREVMANLPPFVTECIQDPRSALEEAFYARSLSRLQANLSENFDPSV